MEALFLGCSNNENKFLVFSFANHEPLKTR
jgi:hypothetical protein